MENNERTPSEALFCRLLGLRDEPAAELAQEFTQEMGADPNELVEHKNDGWEFWLHSRKCSVMHLCASRLQLLTMEKLHNHGGKVDVLDDAGNQPML